MFSGRQGMSIFNRRRRPRQAVYASPQSQSQNATTTIKIEVPDESVCDVANDFDTGRGNSNFTSNHKPSARFSNTSSAQPWQTRSFSLQKHPKNQFNNENIQPKPENTYSGMRQNSGISSEQLQTMTDPKSSWYRGNNFPIRPESQPTSTSIGFRHEKNSVKQPPPTGQNHYSWRNTNSPARATIAGSKARQPGEHDKASFGARQNQYKKIKMEKRSNEVASSSGETFTLKTVDKSMKFVTATIQGLRKWDKYREQVPLIFEIFGTLDCVPTSNNNGTAKLFTIKDSTGMIRCIFWEMKSKIKTNICYTSDHHQDQTLPRMARGQTYRLVGATERKTGHFQCFTIRHVQPVEQRFALKQVAMCDNALTKVVSMIAEA